MNNNGLIINKVLEASNYDDVKYREIMSYITKESGCNVCPICGKDDVVNKISIDYANTPDMIFDHSLICKVCKKSFKYSGKVNEQIRFQLSLASKDEGEYSFRLLIYMLTQARTQVEKKLHDMEDREVEIKPN